MEKFFKEFKKFGLSLFKTIIYSAIFIIVYVVMRRFDGLNPDMAGLGIFLATGAILLHFIDKED